MVRLATRSSRAQKGKRSRLSARITKRAVAKKPAKRKAAPKQAAVSTSKEAMRCLKSINRELSSLSGALNRFEKKLKSQHVHAKKGKRRYSIDAAQKRQLASLEKRMSAFKTKSNQSLNKIASKANRQLKSEAQRAKKQLEQMQKQMRSNNVMMNQLIRHGQAKKNQAARNFCLATKKQCSELCDRFNKRQRELNKLCTRAVKAI